MSLFDRFLQKDLSEQIWQQLTRMLSSEGRLQQLLSLKPIDLYSTTTTYELDGAVIDVDIESFLENILRKRINNTSTLLALGKWALNQNSAYNFHVIVTAKMDYSNAAKYFKHHFAHHDYYFDNHNYHLYIEDIRFKEEDRYVHAELDLYGYTKIMGISKKGKGTLVIRGKPYYENNTYFLSVKELDYHLRTSDIINKFISWWWHRPIKKLIYDFIQYTIEEDLFNGRVMAQEEMNTHQQQTGFLVNGMLTSLELERISYNKEGVQAILLAKGKLDLRR